MLTWATRHSSPVDVVRTLLRHGALVDHNDGRGTCLQTACFMQNEGLSEIVDVLLRNGADETETESGFFVDEEKRGSSLHILEGCVEREIVPYPVRCSLEEKERVRSVAPPFVVGDAPLARFEGGGGGGGRARRHGQGGEGRPQGWGE